MSLNQWIIPGIMVVFNAGILVAAVTFLKKAVENFGDRLKLLEDKVVAMVPTDLLMAERLGKMEGELLLINERSHAVGRVYEDRHIQVIRELERAKVLLEQLGQQRP